MPNIAILNEQIITVSDMYKFDIDKSSDFTCYNCNKSLKFRQSRNAENNFTEHFYHPNTIKDTHIACEINTLDRIRDNDTWHNKLSSFIEQENREFIRKNDDVKHIVDAYDSLNNMGIEFQNSHISVEAIKSRDETTHLDWIFNVENKYIRKVRIGNNVVCEIPHENWEKAVKAVKNNVFLYTGCREWIFLHDRENYRVEIENKFRNVWIGKAITFQQIYEDTCLQNMLTDEGLQFFQSMTKEFECVDIIYARCKKSMYLLDNIHRRYVNSHSFKLNNILAIKSVAGSGKTTTLLKLAQKHSDKKILYLAFNKSLITEIKSKLHKQNIKNVFPQTCDALLLHMYQTIKKRDPEIIDLTSQTIINYIPWLKGKPFKLRKHYVDLYNGFCNNIVYDTPTKFCERRYLNTKPSDESFLNSLWLKTTNHQLISFINLRKLAHIQKWFVNTLDSMYDMIMIDETQDFDRVMLDIILRDTNIPKIFVGDPRQSIYKWRGCVNGFNYLPENALLVEFYSTFRIGDPACEKIRELFTDCWMISKCATQTVFSNDTTLLNNQNYTYLFRSWKALLKSAEEMKDIWISNYGTQIEKMRKLHTILTKFNGTIDDDEYPDDLPQFVKSLSRDELEDLISSIEINIVPKNEAKYKLYTIHSYKGLEDDNVRIADDIEIDGEENEELLYVALTRGMKHIIRDN
jgi:F-box protein 18 (helicase)